MHGRVATARTGAMAAVEAVACMLRPSAGSLANVMHTNLAGHRPTQPLLLLPPGHPCVCSLGITLELTGLESDSSSRAEAQTLLGTCCAACFGEPLLPLAAHTLVLWPRRP